MFRFHPSKWFKNINMWVKGHPKGRVTDSAKTNTDPGSVRDSLNMDFYDDYDQRRDPYSVLADLSSILPSGYTIQNFCEKVFTDADGNSVTCLVVTAVKTSSPAKIYIQNYYNPTTDFGNNHGGSTGWENNAWTELTESKSIFVDTSVLDSSLAFYTLTINDSSLNQTANYYKGWFCYDPDHAYVLKGLITSYSCSAGQGTFQVITSWRSGSLGPPIETITSGITNLVLCRFPVYAKNVSKWSSVVKTEFETDTYNTVKIACGHESRPLNLQFLSEKKFFATAPTISNYKRNWNGFWLSYDVPIIGKKNEVKTYQMGAADYRSEYIESDVGELGIALRYSPTRTDNCVGGTTNPYWTNELWGLTLRLDGFQSIFIKLVCGEKMGPPVPGSFFRTAVQVELDFRLDFERRISHTELYYYRDFPTNDWLDVSNVESIPDPFLFSDARGGMRTINDLPITTDGYQTGVAYDSLGFGITNAFWQVAAPAIDDLYTKGVYVGSEGMVIYEIQISIAGNPDRFIWRKSVNGGAFGSWSGAASISSSPQPVDNKGLLIWFAAVTGHAAGDDWYIYTTTNFGKLVQCFDLGHYEDIPSVPPWWWGKDKGYERNPENIGLSLRTVLNQYWEKEINVSPIKFINVSSNIIALNLEAQNISETSASGSTPPERKQGMMKAAFSQIQRGDINAYSIFSSERIKELAKEEIITGIATELYNFLIFTKQELKWYEIADEKNLLLQNKMTYLTKGAVSAKGVTGLRISGEFAGVYYNNYETIYLFANNDPVDLLEGKWKREYQTLSSSTKEGAIAGSYPNRKEVFFILGSTIWIFNLVRQSWKKYSYADMPYLFWPARSGELMFANNGQQIFITEPIGTSAYLDRGTMGIPFDETMTIDNGLPLKSKIFDEIQMDYEMVTTAPGGTIQPGKIALTIGADGQTNDIYHKEYTLQGDFQMKQKTPPPRTRNNYITLKISDNDITSPTRANIIKFRINRIDLQSKITREKITR